MNFFAKDLCVVYMLCLVYSYGCCFLTALTWRIYNKANDFENSHEEKKERETERKKEKCLKYRQSSIFLLLDFSGMRGHEGAQGGQRYL